MLTPTQIHRRCHEIQSACTGGEPTRAQRITRGPAVEAAVLAYQAAFALHFARDELWFVRRYGRGPLASFAWAYRGYAAKRRIAQACIRSAVRQWREAEERFAMIEDRRAA